MIRRAFAVASVLLIVCIFGVPLVGVTGALLVASKYSVGVVLATAFVAPALFIILFVGVAGALSMPFHRAIRPGIFERDLGSPHYAARRLYGACWGSVYYFKPVYAVCLSIPFLKWLLFRLFGYSGTLTFTVYPDTWIRDLPLLHLGHGAYVSNRATLGTNIVLKNGTLLVDRIVIADRALVGHLAMIAPGEVVGPEAEIGVGCSLGLRCRIDEGAVIQPNCSVSHSAIVGARAVVGTMSYVASGARIPSDTVIRPASVIRRATGERLPVKAGVDACDELFSPAHIELETST